MPLPVSVIVSHLPSRKLFLERYCLPSVRANDPAQIIVETDTGTHGVGSITRNRGAMKATEEIIVCVDDDVILASDFLAILAGALRGHPEAGYAYCDSVELMFPGAPPVFTSNGRLNRPGAFDAARLCQANYISTMTPIRREVFPKFDGDIRRLQDWDLWLTLLGKGITGVYVPQCLFMNCHIDAGITARESKEYAAEKIRAKHAATIKRYA